MSCHPVWVYAIRILFMKEIISLCLDHKKKHLFAFLLIPEIMRIHEHMKEITRLSFYRISTITPLMVVGSALNT